MKKLVVALLCLIITLGCAEELKKKETEKKHPKTSEPIQPMSEDLITHELHATEKPNEYLIKFDWPRSSDAIEIKRAGVLRRAASQAGAGFEETLLGGRSYNYDFKIINSGVSKKVFVKSISVPMDIVLTGKVEYNGATKISANRIFIKKDLQIFSYSHNVEIKANEIIAEGGTIQNFPWGHAICPNTGPGGRGIAGGNITIESKIASGELNIVMVGARSCHQFCNFGGHGGELKVKIEDGLSLKLNTSLLQALGSAKGLHKDCSYRVGSPANACISLKSGDGNECI